MASEAVRSEKNSASVAGSTTSRVEEPCFAVGGGVISKVYGLGDYMTTLLQFNFRSI